MPKAIVLRAPGGPEQLRYEDVVVGEPGAGEVKLRQTAAGVNFHDVYVRIGLVRALPLPGVPGIEAAGVIERVGADVHDFSPGDRVVYTTPRYGAYADSRVIEAVRLVRLPDALSELAAASVFLKGLTAFMLVHCLRPLRAGDTCVVHAAAGGVGSLLCRIASSLGVRVIGTVGSEQKRAIALENGCSDVLLAGAGDTADAIMDLTDGRGADVVYDSVGRDTFDLSLRVLALRGHLINYGQASGPVEGFTPAALAAKSNTLSRPIVFHYIDRPDERRMLTDKLFAALASGMLGINIAATFPLREAAQAHRLIESRKVSGSIVLDMSA